MEGEIVALDYMALVDNNVSSVEDFCYSEYEYTIKNEEVHLSYSHT